MELYHGDEEYQEFDFAAKEHDLRDIELQPDIFKFWLKKEILNDDKYWI
jgi:hypothetical protein